MTLKKIFITVLALSIPLIYLGCNKTTKEVKTPPVKKESKIPPGHARIVGEIVKIEPVMKSDDPKDPCNKVPCIALVKVKGAEYGAGFPTLNNDEEIRIKFQFTLETTNKDLFPNMEETYPGLKVGDEFTALVAHIESLDKTIPVYQIYGYSINY